LTVDDENDNLYYDDDDDDDDEDDDGFQTGGYDTQELNEYLKNKFTEDDAPLANGLNSIRWVPCCSNPSSSSNKESTTGRDNKITQIRKDAKLLPLFPLDEAHIPHTEHVMNIFEPRYREMYRHLENGDGDKQFVVTMTHPTEDNTFAQYGVILTAKEIMDVAEATEDEVKFIANHKVTGRVKINRILNPEDWETADTYLRVEATVLEDFTNTMTKEEEAAAFATETSSTSEKGLALRKNFAKLVDLQHELDQDVRFTKASIATFANGTGSGKKGLWLTINSWQQYAEQCLVIRQTELQDGFDLRLVEYLTKTMGADPEDIPSVIDVNELPDDLAKEAQDIERRTEEELVPLQFELTLSMQKFLDASSHEERLDLLNYNVEQDLQRLSTKKTLQSIFPTLSTTEQEEDGEDNINETNGEQLEEWRTGLEKSFNIVNESTKNNNTAKRSSSVKAPKIVESRSIFVDESDDAFQ